MDYFQFFTLLITMLGGFGLMYREFKQAEKDLRDDIKTQAARSDRLFEMYLEAQKDNNQKFYDLLKGGK